MSKRGFLIALLVIIVLGAMARLYRLDEKSLWSDEIATIATSLGNSIDPDAHTVRGEAFDPPQPVPAATYLKKATQSHGAGNLARTAEVLRGNVHPPLFFGLMNPWIHAFGFSPTALRLPAALFGILCLPLIALLALRIGRLSPRWGETDARGFALLAAAIMAFSAYQIDHAQDARQYTLLLLLAMSAVWQMIGLSREKSGWPGWVALAVLLAAGLYTQYFFMVFAGFVLAYLAWQGRGDKALLLKLVGTALLVGLLFAPWYPNFKAQMTFFRQAGHYTAGLWNPLQLPEKLWRIFCEFFMPDSRLGKLLPFLVLLNAVVTASVAAFRHREKHTRISAALALILLWIVAVLGGQVLLDLLKETHTATIRRYLLLASPACVLLLAYALVSIGRIDMRGAKILRNVLAVLLLAGMLGDTARYLWMEHAGSDEFKQAAVVVNPSYQPGDVVWVTKSGPLAVGMAYYLDPATSMLGIHVARPKMLHAGAAYAKHLATIASGYKRVWVVFSHAPVSSRTRLGLLLKAQGFHRQSERKVPGIRVWLMARKP